MRGISASALEQRRRVAAAAEEDGYASNATNPSTIGGISQGRLNGKGRPMLKLRSVPVTNEKPEIVSRTTKTVALP